MRTTFIYGLFSESDNIIRYVGKSDDPNYRLKRHIYQRNDSNTYKNNWIRSLINSGQKIGYTILDEVPYQEWPQKEKYWISKFDGLVNTSDGGLGGCVIKYKLSYDECKEWVKINLNINSKNSWVKNNNGLPDYIPKNPNEVYRKRGWISWGDFLGTGRVQDNKKVNYLSYDDAKKWIIGNNVSIKCLTEWKTINLPNFLPRRPDRYYRNRGWVSWSDFLSNNRVQNQKKEFLSYNDCIIWLHENYNTIESHSHWKNIRKNFPNYIPTNPNIHYKNKGWISWVEFFNSVKYIESKV